MVKSDPGLHLPTSAELPCSDDIPVDNEDQNFIPNFLLFLLEFIWTTRNDWFFGVDMALYHTTGVSPQVPVVPDGFLSLGVEHNPEYWQRDRHQPFEVYHLVDGTYRLQIGEPFWMPEIGLGIGRSLRVSGDVQREVLYWYDEQGLILFKNN